MTSEKSLDAQRTTQVRRNDAEVYDDGCLHVEHKGYFVACKGTQVALSKSEFLLLSRMARSIDRVVRSEDLWAHICGVSKPLNLDSLQVLVCRLRRKFESFGLRIDSMIHVGYILSHGSCCDAGDVQGQSVAAGGKELGQTSNAAPQSRSQS